jgi:thiol-disulfide isomerase/thioredoxin
MKKLSLLFIFILLSGIISIGQNSQKNKNRPIPNPKELAEKKTILQVEEDFRKAKIENNINAIDEILAEQYSGTNQFGYITNKEQAKTAFTDYNKSLAIDNMNVVLTSDSTAILTGLQKENGNQMNFTRNYIRQKGKWQILSSIQKFPEFQNAKGLGYYRINGHLKGADGVTISLVRNVGNNTVNSAIVKDGIFVMEGKAIEYPEIFSITAPGKQEKASFFLENSEIAITGHVDSLSKIKVTGSKTQNEFFTFLSAVEPFRGNLEAKYSAYQSANEKKEADKISQTRQEFEELAKQLDNVQKEFIMNHPQSYTVPIILSNIANRLSTSETETIIKSLDPGVAKTPSVIAITDKLYVLKLTEIGQKAPNFTLNDVNGKPVSLSSKIGSKLLLIDFWASWCGPCRAENPNVVQVYNEFKSKGFDIIGVSLDRNKEDWVKAIEKDHLYWTHVSDLQYWNSAAAKLYMVNSIPANFLLDQIGVIVAKNLRGEALLNKVNELLNKK